MPSEAFMLTLLKVMGIPLNIQCNIDENIPTYCKGNANCGIDVLHELYGQHRLSISRWSTIGSIWNFSPIC